jgi:two-component system, NarL family, nitrate/nitrite response regulator NarL
MANRIRIAFVDDHDLIRRGLRETLGECIDFEIVGEGENAEEALEIAQSVSPDVMLIDVNMPGNGLTAVERIVKLNRSTKILILSVYDNLENVRSAMMSGASGYVLKGVIGDDLVSIIKRVHAGSKHVAPELAAKLFSEIDSNTESAPKADSYYSLLTRREKQILALIQKGLPNADIAKKLKLSEATVKHYITPMFRKLAVKNRTEAALLKGVKLHGQRTGA